NDADSPLIDVVLAGAGVLPPVVGVQPSSFTSTLNEGAEETQNLRILNSGPSPLVFSLEVRPSALGATRVPFAGLAHAAGTSNNPPLSTSQRAPSVSETTEPRFRAAAAELGLRQSSPQ